MEILTKMVESKIIATIPGTFAIVFHDRTHAETYYLAMFSNIYVRISTVKSTICLCTACDDAYFG